MAGARLPGQGGGMRHYLRMRAKGGTYFFTVNLAERRGNGLLVDQVGALRNALRVTRSERPFELQAIVVLPDHLHCLWRLPNGDDDFSTRWQLIKSRFSRALPATERRTRSRRNKSERGLWQRRYWEHPVGDDRTSSTTSTTSISIRSSTTTCMPRVTGRIPRFGNGWREEVTNRAGAAATPNKPA
jgi:REP element-mobilizing transposase RayT